MIYQVSFLVIIFHNASSFLSPTSHTSFTLFTSLVSDIYLALSLECSIEHFLNLFIINAGLMDTVLLEFNEKAVFVVLGSLSPTRRRRQFLTDSLRVQVVSFPSVYIDLVVVSSYPGHALC